MTMPQSTATGIAEPAPSLLPPDLAGVEADSPSASARQHVWRTRFWRILAVLLALQIAGSAAQPWRTLFRQEVTAATRGWGFDLLRWEIDAVGEKAGQIWSQPAAALDEAQASNTVEAYLARARDVRRLEDEAAALLANGNGTNESALAQALADASALRDVQGEQRPIAESVVQAQIAQALVDAGFEVGERPMPPVLFTFTESPRKLVISPRSRITTLESRILNPGMPLDAIEAAEAQIEGDGDVSAYIAETGGMGAFPTMVVDDASLPWILSTVAHEWVHTYLSFFKLGFNYGVTPENTTINETVADIVGDEIGLQALRRFYPHVPEPKTPDLEASEEVVRYPWVDAPFDYRAEMRETRRVADQLLRAGRVEDAERYMEVRRLLFVENGYHLRKLNQAWFAFHGSYGTGPAADVSSPDAIAPKVQRLRELTPDLRTFVHAVRGVVDADGLDRVLAEWEQK